MFTVEHEFELPQGYIDEDGGLHRRGVMRLATAADEILPMRDPRVAALPAYLIVILLSRVVLHIGTVTQINPGVIERLFSRDLDHLQELYNRINGLHPPEVDVSCPSCGTAFRAEVPPPGESSATPWTGSTGRSPTSDVMSTGPRERS